jgi:hypothetical protein
MLLQDLIKNIDLTKAKLIRHNLTNDEMAQNYALGYIEDYQRIQTKSRFKDCAYVFSFLGEQGTEGTLIGCYRLAGYVPREQAELPGDLYFSAELDDDCVCWTLEKTDIRCC